MANFTGLRTVVFVRGYQDMLYWPKTEKAKRFDNNVCCIGQIQKGLIIMSAALAKYRKV